MDQLKDPDQIYRMVMKIGQEYGRPMPVKVVNCLSEKEIEDILEKTNYKETDNEIAT